MKHLKSFSIGNKKGVATILVVGILLFFLLGFLLVGIDFAYMYYVRGQLQNAADAAALAGAKLLTGDSDNGTAAYAQMDARKEAWKFACKNTAAGQKVFLEQEGGKNCDNPPSSGLNENGNDANGDIIVGYWNGTDFIRADGTTDNPINAVKVWPKRVSGSPTGGPVPLLFNKIIPGVETMGIRTVAIAARIPRALAPISICFQSCTPPVAVDADHPLTLYWAPYPSEANPGYQGIAWTAFLPVQSSDKELVISYFCGKDIDACNLPPINSTNGNDNSVGRQFRCAMKNPLYDSADKTCADGACDSATDTVTSWTVLIPYFSEADGCPPGSQPTPYTVAGYAKITITEVYANGGGGTSDCACGAYDAPAITGPSPNAIVITGISCASCDDPAALGPRALLVK